MSLTLKNQEIGLKAKRFLFFSPNTHCVLSNLVWFLSTASGTLCFSPHVQGAKQDLERDKAGILLQYPGSRTWHFMKAPTYLCKTVSAPRGKVSNRLSFSNMQLLGTVRSVVSLIPDSFTSSVKGSVALGNTYHCFVLCVQMPMNS